MPTEAVTLYAMWAKNTDADYTLNANGGYFGTDTTATTRTATGTEGESLTTGTNYAEPVWPGHTFKGWAENSTDTTYSTALPIVAGKTYYAVWDTKADITVNFDPQGGAITSGSAVQTGTFDTALTAPTAKRSGYTFDGWYTAANGGGDKLAASPKFPTASTTYYANWTAKKDNSVTFSAGTNGTTASTTSFPNLESGKTVTANGVTIPTIATKTGFNFTGYWQCDKGGVWSTAEVDSYVITGAGDPDIITFTAIYTPIEKATVIFDYAGGADGSNNTISYTQGYPGESCTTPTVSRTGYTFNGWDNTPTGVYGAAGSLTVYKAQWTSKTNTVTYAADNGTVPAGSTDSVLTGNKPLAAKVPTVTANAGYTFSGKWLCSSGGTFTAAEIANYTVTENVIFTAICTENGKATIIFDYAGGTLGGETMKTLTGVSGTAVGTIPTFGSITKTGYTCTGWNETLVTTYGTAGSVTTYTAQWTARNDYSVEYAFTPAGAATVSGLPATVYTATYDAAVGGTTPAPVTNQPGYTFTGNYKIYVDGTDTGLLTADPTTAIVSGNMKFVAVFDTTSSVTVTFDLNGGAWTATGTTNFPGGVKTGTPGSALTAPTGAEATRTGYELGGWTPTVPATFPNAPTTYKANWTAKDNKVSFVQGANGTMTQVDYTVKSGAAVSSAAGYNAAALAPTATTGYDFTGYWLCSEGGVWSTAEAGGYIISGENATVTFTALYTAQNDAIVVFDYAGGIGSDGAGMSILHGQPGTALTAPANPTRVGYTFDQWDTTPAATFGAEGSVTTYTATWTPVSNTVTYKADNGAVSVTTSEQVTTGSSPVKAGDVTVTPTTGFTFTGSWACSEGGIYTTAQIAGFVVTKNVTFTALCTENGKSTVLFDFGGGTDETASYKIVSGIAETPFPAGTIPTGITRTGHTLQIANDGWDRPITSIFGLAGTITTYTLQWDITSITVTFLAGSHGTMTPAVSAPSVEHGKSVASIPAITADTGWTFTGWLCSKDNKVYTDTGVAIYPVTEAVTFTAQYADAENATVFFDYNGGKVGTATSSSAQGKTGTAITFPTPTRTDGFTLTGWTPTADGAVFGNPGTTQTYVAQWTPVSTNTVTYAENAPTSPAGTVSGMPAPLTEAYDVGDIVTVAANPRCTNGYTFAGWLASGALTGTYQSGDTFTMPNGNVTLTAQWNDPSSVLIAFDANGGSMTAGSVSSSVTVGEKATVPTVSKPGYTLTGWTSSNDTHYPDLGKAATESAAAVANENVTYTAQWAPNDNTVTYAVQHGTLTGGTTETVKTDASPVNVPTVTADTGYNFDDALWLCEVEGAGTTAGSYTTAELANYIVTGNVTFTAICAQNGPATIVFDYDGGTDGTAGFKVITGTAETSVESGKIPTPTKAGFDFDAWTPANIVYGAESTITPYKATWTAKEYTVTYAWSGDLPADITDADLPVDGNTYHWHDALTPAAGPATAETSKNGVPGTWSFDGWTANAGLTADGIEADVVYTGSWTFTAAGYTVTYVFSGDVPAGAVVPTDNNSYNWHDTVTVEADASTTETTKNGVPGAWAFDGWTTTSDLTNGIEGNVVYTGSWTFTPDKISVTFDAGTDGRFTTTGDPLATQSIDAGTTVGGVPTITANGRYTFLGWEIENGDGTRYSNAAVASMTLIADTTFTAAYQQTTTSGGGGGGGTTTYYTLSFQENGGSALTPVSATSGTVIDLGKYDTTRTGYTFEGWYADEALTQPIDSVKLTKNTVVYAKWSFNGGLNTEDHFAYVVGYSDGTVRPNANISRAETATILYRLLTAERRDAIFTSSNSFTDVSRDLWYNKAVSSMANGGYIQGYEDGTFGGNRSITRAEFVAMVVRFLGTTNGTASFNDVSTSHWAYKYIATATSAGWINGYTDGSFKPEQAITRAEAMAIINRVLDRGTDENGVMAGFKAWPDNQVGAWYYYEVIEATNAHQYEGARPSEDWTGLTTDYSYDIAKYERP